MLSAEVIISCLTRRVRDVANRTAAAVKVGTIAAIRWAGIMTDGRGITISGAVLDGFRTTSTHHRARVNNSSRNQEARLSIVGFAPGGSLSSIGVGDEGRLIVGLVCKFGGRKRTDRLGTEDAHCGRFVDASEVAGCKKGYEFSVQRGSMIVF